MEEGKKEKELEKAKRVARSLHNEGIELTPQQVIEEKNKAFAIIKEALEEKGYKFSDDVLEILLKEAIWEEEKL